MENCENCPETKKLFFQIKDMGIQMQAQELQIESVQQKQDMRDLEHETMIQNLTTRMDTMSDDFKTLKTEMRQDIQGIRDDIPTLFETSVNALLAKIATRLLISIGILIAVVILAVTRPILVKGISEIKTWIETVEVVK